MPDRILRLSWLPGKFAVCRLPQDAALPAWAGRSPFSSVTRTAEELSIVCAADSAPEEHKPKNPWVCLKLEGPFSFSEVGVLASVVNPLAEKAIPVFAISTFDTDYVLINENFAGAAMQALRDVGHEFLS